MLFEVPLEKIEALMVKTETHFKMKRDVLILKYGDEAARIYVSDIIGFKDGIEKVSAKKYGKIGAKECAVMSV